MPYEYILCLQLALVPPLWYYIMNPRVKAIRDAFKGIENPDQWNNDQPMSAADKTRNYVACAYFILTSAGLTALAFM
jgi:hypothetical protein